MTGLANKKTVSIQPAGEDLAVVLATTKTRKQNKPVDAVHKSILKKEFHRMAKAVVNQVFFVSSHLIDDPLPMNLHVN